MFGETFDAVGNNNKHKGKDTKFEPTVWGLIWADFNGYKTLISCKLTSNTSRLNLSCVRPGSLHLKYWSVSSEN